MKILLTGGGTGGHITPILAVAHELKSLQPDTELVYVGERGGKFARLVQGSDQIDRTQQIFAGKFRRYHGESLLKRLLDLRTLLLNVRDLFYFCLGFLQSLVLLRREKPDVIFLKGGFVGVPVGLAAAFWRIPFVTHDSDILPGLANRIVSRWARVHATGMPIEYYPYPAEKTRHVGVLVSSDFQQVTTQLQSQYKTELNIPEHCKVLLVTGGSLGARKINDAALKIIPSLLEHTSDLFVIHQVGKHNAGIYGPFTHERLMVIEFMDGQHRYMGAADVVVTRAGANTLAEFGVLAKACIVIPNPLLTGGHQVMNAEFLHDKQAAIILDESLVVQDAQQLGSAITELLTNSQMRQQIAETLHAITISDAAHQLALVLLHVIQSDHVSQK